MIRISSRQELIDFQRTHGLRYDWHEPDEQNITARVEGVSFDNAGFWPTDPSTDRRTTELHVIFSRTEWTAEAQRNGEPEIMEDLACVNLAYLCAWSTGLDF